ncbi:MAG: SGNH/GDSL hydrolase family protein [Clostridia bacterium]|nr:SGNH/GDSL hydrolase family protein [Clostridia bacterium]
MKRAQKFFSLLLAVVMAFTLCAPAFAAENDTTKLVLLGDSIAQGYGLGNGYTDWYDLGYGKIIAEANGYDYVNHAIGGHTTYNLNARLQEETVISDVADADIIAVSIGGNNFLLGGMQQMIIDAILFKKYDLIEKTIGEFYVDFGLALDKIKAINPEAQLLVQTLYNPRDDILGTVYQRAVDLLNEAITNIAVERNGAYVVVDIYPAFEGHIEYIQDDKIHPNETGHYVIASEYLKVLKDLGLGEADKPLSDMPEIEIPLTFWQKIIEFFKGILSFIF